MPAERGAECARRAVADAFGDLGEPEIGAAEQILREVTTESDVAVVVWRAANDVSGQLRFPAGADAVALAQSR